MITDLHRTVCSTGEDGLQAMPAGGGAAAASAASLFSNMPTQQHPQLSSIQLLHLRAQQHLAAASFPPAASQAAASNANAHSPMDEAQPHPQAGVLLGSRSNDFLPWGVMQPLEDPQPPQSGSAPPLGALEPDSASQQLGTGPRSM